MGAAAVETTRLVRTTTLVCIVAALVCALVGTVLGHAVDGALAGLGVLVGAANPHLTRLLLRTGLPLASTSLFRITGLSGIVVLVALGVGLGRAWLMLLGVGAAQLVLAVTAVLEMSRR